MEIETIVKLELKPGDMLVLKTSEYLSREHCAAVLDSWRSFFPENRVVLLQGGQTIEVLSATPPYPTTTDYSLLDAVEELPVVAGVRSARCLECGEIAPQSPTEAVFVCGCGCRFTLGDADPPFVVGS